MAMKFYANVAQRLKLKAIKLQGLILTFVVVTGEKLVGRPVYLKLNFKIIFY